MAPKKRKINDVRSRAAATTPARVTCPGCQKEVPSFFVNSHLDLDCPVLKPDCRQSASPISTRPAAGGPTPSLDILQRKTLRIEKSVSNFSVGDKRIIASSLSEGDRGNPGTLQNFETDDSLSKTISGHQIFASFEEEDDDDVCVRECAHDVQSDMPTGLFSLISRSSDSEPDNDQGPGKSQFQGTGILSPYSSSQFGQRMNERQERAIPWRGPASKLVAISDNFLSSPLLKVNSPKGLQIIENFITAEEEEHLTYCLDADISNPWKPSTVNGVHRGKSYGNHIFGDSKRRVVSQVSNPMPNFVLPYVERMRNQVPVLNNFFPNEMNSIEYRKGHGDYLKAHMDDRQLSGTVLVNLSLAGGCFMTYTRELGRKEVFRVKLLARSLQILTGESRYNYTHGIQKNDIFDSRRVSMTFRQSASPSQTFRPSR